MSLGFEIPDYKKIRVIIDTDAACEADDPFAIAHALMSPKLIVKGILAEHFNAPESVEKSFAEIQTILAAMEMEKDIPVFMGQKTNINDDKTISPAVDFLISEALKENEKPLYILCQGAITNVAVALKKCPQIKTKMTIIWIGTNGPATSKAPWREFNAGNDITAANFVLSSGVKMWIIPSTVYSTINIGIAEIERRIAPCGKIGKHLFEQLVEYNKSESAGWTQGESWSLGDSPAVAIAINPMCGKYVDVPAPFIQEDTSSAEGKNMPTVRFYTNVDSRYILEDFIAKLELHYKK